ncbi:hypothetical protein C1H46_034864 [Malus baccata]|uniref:Uncharacterized protein n=1 Tax=Malus baccata TaxID=106549 RepID=A0A540KZD9_MALBA|nr:hypothetical protein C1H46_034864 [Malus baccata]
MVLTSSIALIPTKPGFVQGGKNGGSVCETHIEVLGEGKGLGFLGKEKRLGGRGGY